MPAGLSQSRAAILQIDGGLAEDGVEPGPIGIRAVANADALRLAMLNNRLLKDVASKLAAITRFRRSRE